MQILFVVFLLWSFATDVFAQVPDKFLVEVSKNPAEPNEKIDLTVTALRSDGTTETWFTGSILMFFDTDDSQTFDDDIFQLPSNSIYTFIAEDLGKKTFSKGLSVARVGTYDFVVSLLNDASVEGKIAVIVGGDPNELDDLQAIEVFSPASGDTISSSVINILWKTDAARAPLQILINGKLLEQEGETQPDGEFNIFANNADIESGSNMLQVRVTNFDGQIIGKSPEIPFLYNPPSSDGLFKGLTVSPWDTVKANEKITFLVETDASVNNVELKIGSLIRPLTKSSQTSFTNDVLLEPGQYSTDVTLILDDGERKLYEDQILITVEDSITIEQIKLVKDINNEWTVQLSWDVTGGEADNFVIAYGQQKDLLSQREETSTQNFLFQNLSGSEYFFQITPVDADGNVVGDNSDIVSIVLDDSGNHNSPGWGNSSICSVQWINVSTTRIGDSYYLVWPNISGATKYIIYRSEFSTNSISQMRKVSETTDTKFPYPFDPLAVEDQYTYYAVQAVCSDWQTVQVSAAKKVKVGPVTDLFFLLAITVLCYLLYVLYWYSIVKE